MDVIWKTNHTERFRSSQMAVRRSCCVLITRSEKTTLVNVHQLWHKLNTWKGRKNIEMNRNARWILCYQEVWELFSYFIDSNGYEWSPANNKGENKDSKTKVGRSTIVHNLLFRSDLLCMSYIIKRFLLVRSRPWCE